MYSEKQAIFDHQAMVASKQAQLIEALLQNTMKSVDIQHETNDMAQTEVDFSAKIKRRKIKVVQSQKVLEKAIYDKEFKIDRWMRYK